MRAISVWNLKASSPASTGASRCDRASWIASNCLHHSCGAASAPAAPAALDVGCARTAFQGTAAGGTAMAATLAAPATAGIPSTAGLSAAPTLIPPSKASDAITSAAAASALPVLRASATVFAAPPSPPVPPAPLAGRTSTSTLPDSGVGWALRRGGACAPQSIVGEPTACRNRLACEKCRQPKKPRRAESGDGCAACSTQCAVPSMSRSLPCACRPHRMKTSPPRRRADSVATAASVSRSQPRPACEAGVPARTVSAVLSSSTPCSAQPARQPCDAGGTPTSACSSAASARNERAFKRRRKTPARHQSKWVRVSGRQLT
eukprot:1455566-Prymnesium_polylepis.1